MPLARLRLSIRGTTSDMRYKHTTEHDVTDTFVVAWEFDV